MSATIESSPAATPVLAVRLGRWRGRTLAPSFLVAILTYAFLYLPVAVLIVFSFNDSSLITDWTHPSLRWYYATFSNSDVRRALANSFVVAASASMAATIIAALAALAMVRGQRFETTRRISSYVILTPTLIPEIVISIALLLFFSTTGLHLGVLNLVVAHTLICTPFAFMPIRANLRGMNPSLEQAARDLYCTPVQAFFHVTLPLLTPGLLASAILATVVSIDNFILSFMVSASGASTVPVYIYSFVRQGVTPGINVLSVTLFLTSAMFVVIYWRLTKRGGRSA